MEDSELTQQKDIQHYGASVNAWFNTALEHDKSILALSAAGIGLLTTLLTTADFVSAEALVLYILAILSFLIAIACVLFVFNRNKDYIERMISGANSATDPGLTKLDHGAILAFAAGVVFSAVIGISAGINSYANGDSAMSNKPHNSDQHQLNESFNNASRLQPQNQETKSFNGAAALRPSAPATTQPTNTPAQQPATTQPAAAPAAGESNGGES